MSQTRRLAAILAADVAGYSRLIGVDEGGTLERLKALRRELLDPKIAEHRGRLVKTTGDGLLVEFASVVDALRCAVEVQREIVERGGDGPSDRRIELRIGIHQGDIVVEDGDIFGDGVNVAARLEALADPGGICVSARVQEDAAGRLDLAFADMGEQNLKNIARPIRVFRVGPLKVSAPTQAPLPLPDKPSIAVLLFQNMSGDPEQEVFADGMVEDITTALSKLRWFFVIARNSSFAYKGRAIDIRQVGRELGVRYVLEGSVRSGRDRVRITAQLLDSTSGAHLWAGRYDCEIGDMFALQDEIALSVVGAIEPSCGRPRSSASGASGRKASTPTIWCCARRAMPIWRCPMRQRGHCLSSNKRWRSSPITRPPTRCSHGAFTRVFSAAVTVKRIAPQLSAMPMRRSRRAPTMLPQSALRRLSLHSPSMTQLRRWPPSTEQQQSARATLLFWVSGRWRWPSADRPSWPSNGPSVLCV